MITSAACFCGKPKTPVEMAGKDMDSNPNSSATRRHPVTAASSLASSSPSPQTGPTAWMTYRQGSLPPVVQAGLPWLTSPCFPTQAFDSAWISGPPPREIAPATPAPWIRASLAALTIASLVSAVISPCTSWSFAPQGRKVEFTCWFTRIFYPR